MKDKSSRQLDSELRQMEGEVKRTVDINYEKYNNEFMRKVAQHNEALKRENAERTDREIHTTAKDGSRYLHNKAKRRTIII